MNASRIAADHAALGWIKPELDALLQQARIELEAHADRPGDGAALRACAQALQQVRGSLQMLDLEAATLVADELRRLALALGDGATADADDASAVLMSGLVLLPDYLDRLQAGHRDVPVVLLPLLNQVRAARGEAAFDEAALAAMGGPEPPTEAEVEHARAAIGGRNRALLGTVSAAVKEDLMQVKDALDLHLRGTRSDVSALQPHAATLGRVADTLAMIGLARAGAGVGRQRDALAAIADGRVSADEGALLDIAGALLHVDATLDEQVVRGGEREDDGDDALSSESRRVTAVLMREAGANLAQVREGVLAYIHDGGAASDLADAPRLLQEIGGALRMLEQAHAADLVTGVRAYLRDALHSGMAGPGSDALDRLADAVTSLDMYLEQLADGTRREDLLDIVRSSLATLGYWPLTAAALRPDVVALDADDGDADADSAAGDAAGDAPPSVSASAPSPGAGVPVPPPAVVAPAASAPMPAAASGFEGAGEEIDDEIREVFLEEFEEEIGNLGQLLPEWRAQPDDLDRLRPIRRVFHTLKGSGRLVGARLLGEFSWKIENMLNRVLDGSRAATPAVLRVVDQAHATLPQLHAALRGDGQVTADLDALQRIADRVAAGEEAQLSPPQGDAPGAVDAEDAGIATAVDPVLLEILDAEVSGHLQAIDAWLAASNESPAPDEPLLRALHTSNGAFAMTDVPAITDLLSPAEGYVKRLRAAALPASAAGIAAIAEVASAIGATIAALRGPRPRVHANPALAERLRALRDALPEPGNARDAAGHMPQDIEPLPVDFDGLSLEPMEGASVESLLQEHARHADEQAHADRLAGERAESERLAARAAEAAMLDAERIAAERAESERLAAEQADAKRAAAEQAEAERLAAEQAEAERVAAEQAEAERLAAERAEADRLAAEQAEAERLAAEQAETERVAAEQAESERLAAERAEAERVAAEQAESERLAAERAEADRLAAEQAEAERVAAEDAEYARLEAEFAEEARRKAETERLAAERAEAERMAAAQTEAERIAAEQAQAERMAAERAEQDRLAAAQAEAERLAAEQAESERVAAEQAEAERVAAEQAEAERLAAEQAEAERVAAEQAEAERLAAEQAEAERVAAEQAEAERVAAEQAEAERLAAEQAEAERLAAEQAESERLAAEQAELRRVEAERRAAEDAEARRLQAEREDAERLARKQQAEQARVAGFLASAAAVGAAEDPDEALDLSGLDSELVDLFIEEARDLLDHSDNLLAKLRESPESREPIAGLQRDLHTIKGGARMAGIMAVGELGHAMESLLEGVAGQKLELGRGDVPLLERGFDRLHGMVTRVGARRAIGLPSQLIAEFDARARGEALSDAATSKVELKPLSAPIDPDAPLDDDDIGVRAPQEQVRIRADLLDRLVNYAGEVAIYRARLEQQLGAFRSAMFEMEQTNARLRDQLRRLDAETEAQIIARYQRENALQAPDAADPTFDPLELDRFSTLQQLSRALAESAADMSSLQGTLDDLTRQYETLLLQQSRVSSDLQEGLMRTRMVPFDALVPRLRRVVRQAAGDTGKQAQLKLDGAQGELDRNVLDRMTAPLEHMLRNAIAHGLESPAARARAGKGEEGTVRIGVRREGSEVVLEVGDDGAGLDRAAIRRRAQERGLLRADAVLADSDLDALILEPGFSTADEVSRLAGRGVGMDVVASEVRQLGGTLDIASRRGEGTTFVLRLPQTLAVTQAVFVRIGETSFAVPIASVRGVGRISREELAAGDATYRYGGEDYALHDLGLLLGHAPARAEGQVQMPLLLVRSGELRAAVAIDQVLGNREIVVKPVGPQVASIPGIFGATIMGDGRVVVILDLAPLVRRHAALPRDVAPADPLDAAHGARPVPLVMVVDDSITMRKVTGRVLERHNLEVVTAKDGVDALERLEERVPDLMLLDIEMPRMDGYELATQMRADPRFRGVPIVMITSRTGEKHRQRAFEIGVQRYLGKPYQEPELMRNVFELLGVEPGRDGSA